MDIEIKKTKVEPKSHTLIKPNNTEPTTDKHAAEYYDTHMVSFEKFNCTGWKTIEVLGFLNGKPWDDLALGYVHALRPSSVRVTKGMIKLDACVWRVTVYISEDNIIRKIKQEVEVGLPENVAHGEAMGMALKYGIDSPQCQWYNGENGGYVMMPHGYFKRTKDGWVKFPEPEEEPLDYAEKVLDE